MNKLPRRLTGILLAGVLATGTALAGGSVHRTTNDIYLAWDASVVVGTATVVRSPNGISTTFKTSGLYAGHAMTLWFAVFNNPSACATSPCGGADLANPAVAGDFVYVAGTISNAKKTTIGGHVSAGDPSISGWNEFGLPELAIGLTNPMGAEIHPILRSHGPALSGQALVAQISSYLGGCEIFLGDANNFATGPQDVPDAPHECADIQFSVHQSALAAMRR